MQKALNILCYVCAILSVIFYWMDKPIVAIYYLIVLVLIVLLQIRDILTRENNS